MNLLLIGGCGYAGSYLFNLLSETHTVTSVDLERRGNPGMPNLVEDYGFLPRDYYNQFDDIILLAATASIPEVLADPTEAFFNNLVSFQRLVDILRDDQPRIYASSSSVYSGFPTIADETNVTAGNMYDFTKLADDILADLSKKHCYGLRFGTINGPSPNVRFNLMINQMVATALTEKCVKVQNPTFRRPILGMDDLGRAVTMILNGNGAPGVYNLASFEDTIEDIGVAVAQELDVPVIIGDSTPAYDIAMSTAKFQKEYDFRFKATAHSIVRDLVN